jgi:2,4-dienoyl-CoA reductase (NADPH2)
VSSSEVVRRGIPDVNPDMTTASTGRADASRPQRRYRHLLAPLALSGLVLRNRIVKSSTVLGFAAEDGNAGAMLVDHYEALAQGGAGLIVAESSCVDFPLGGKGENRLRIDEDRFVDSFARLADGIHRHGAATILQLTHNGPAGKFSGLQPIAASALAPEEIPVSDPRVKYDPPRAMTRADIERAVEKHADAAWRAQCAGFDGVEVHAGHSYLINSFLSRAWNRRDDEYGVHDLDTRARFATEIIRAIRARVGSRFVIGMRVNGEEWGHERGLTGEESSALAQRLEAAGLDLIHVTGWGYGHGAYSWVQYPEQLLYPEPAVPLAKWVRRPGVLASRAAIIKGCVSIPVVAVGSMTPQLGEWVLRKGLADLVAMGRPLMADPELPRKLAEGRPEDIRPCMTCLECRTPFQRYRPTACRVNAGLGREREYAIAPAAVRKRVVVVGGGPAGMEAARVAAARGHEVTLYERGSRLGGSMRLAALVKGTQIEDLPGLVDYFAIQLAKLGVRIELNRAFTPEIARQLCVDAAVVATGSRSVKPDLAGIERAIVVTPEALQRRARPFLDLFGPRVLGVLTRMWLPIGKRVVVIGGELHGCQLAAFLIKRGRRVTIVEESDELGAGIPIAMRPRLLDWLRERGAELLTATHCREIGDDAVVIAGPHGTRRLPADSVVTAIAPACETALADALRSIVPEVHPIGDCNNPHSILQAIADGARIGHAL